MLPPARLGGGTSRGTAHVRGRMSLAAAGRYLARRCDCFMQRNIMSPVICAAYGMCTADRRGAASAAADGTDTEPPASWEALLDILSSLIKHKTRADGRTWRDAHENMPTYLQV